VIARSVGAGADDVVLLVGSGATAAINKLVWLLGLRGDNAAQASARGRPLVLVGPYEHHSNQIPWLESQADVIEIGLDARGGIDRDDLDRQLRAHPDRPLIVGAFSAASNVTGLLTDVHAIARRLHRAGAVAVFDYAAAAPYVPIDMRPAALEDRLDAIMLSTHKFAAGPAASGVLVVNRALCRAPVPERPGGGTVDYVRAVEREAIGAEQPDARVPAQAVDRPRGHRLLVIDRERSERYRQEILAGNLGAKPGWVRLTLPFYASSEDVEFMLAAIEIVADHGEAFVPLHALGWRDGVWRHHESRVFAAPADKQHKRVASMSQSLGADAARTSRGGTGGTVPCKLV